MVKMKLILFVGVLSVSFNCKGPKKENKVEQKEEFVEQEIPRIYWDEEIMEIFNEIQRFLGDDAAKAYHQLSMYDDAILNGFVLSPNQELKYAEIVEKCQSIKDTDREGQRALMDYWSENRPELVAQAICDEAIDAFENGPDNAVLMLLTQPKQSLLNKMDTRLILRAIGTPVICDDELDNEL